MKSPAVGAIMAAAVAGLFLAGSGCPKKATNTDTSDDTATSTNTTSDDADTGDGNDAETVECYGINECKGKGECGSAAAGTSCAGTNECKGKGWISLTAEDCKDKGGSTSPN